MKRNAYFCKIICALLCYMMCVFAFVGCNQKHPEVITIYPSYFNQDIDGVNCTNIRTALEQEGWILENTSQSITDGSTVYTYKLIENSETKVISINEYTSVAEAERSYTKEWTEGAIVGGWFSHDHLYHTMRLRISNCTITTLGNAHVDLINILGFESVVPMEAYVEPTFEMCKGSKSVDIDAVRSTMETDGYQFYTTDFIIDSDEFISTYIIVSPNQDRIYAYTLGNKPAWGTPSAYDWVKTSTSEYDVGIHVVGFKDGSNVLCYGDSFEEIRDYFAP